MEFFESYIYGIMLYLPPVQIAEQYSKTAVELILTKHHSIAWLKCLILLNGTSN